MLEALSDTVMALESDTCQIFDNLSVKISSLLYSRNAQQQQYLSLLLNELNSLNYKLPVVTNNTKAVLLIHQCCTIISSSDSDLVEKCCSLITNLVVLQKIVIQDRTLHFAVEWTLQILKQSDKPSITVLKCLESLIRDKIEHIQEFLPTLIGHNGILIKLSQEKSTQEIQFWAVKCLEAITYCKEEQSSKLLKANVNYVKVCTNMFITLLMEERLENSDEIINSKLFVSCLRGIQSTILQDFDLIKKDLGLLLGISRSYATYCLYNTNWVKPEKIMPSNLNIADLKPTSSREKKGGKMTKQRKQRKSTSHKKDESKRNENRNFENANTSYTPFTVITENTSVQISDSDVSDSETNKSNKIPVAQGKVRQAALNMLLYIVKVTDKHEMFGYWSSLFPSSAPYGAHTLNQCLLQEPSPRGRIAILNVISTILNGSKLYLSQAESSEKSFAFIPFSITLGSMIEELHHSLCLALKDASVPVLTQILKCLALLVQATPYHRLSSGLITEVIKRVHYFLRHRDVTVQVAALIVLGCVVASEPVVPETVSCLRQDTTKIINVTRKPLTDSEQDVECVGFSSDDESQIPETTTTLPWLLEKCLRNLGVVYNTSKRSESAVPAPVKLESVQVLAAMCRNYYPVMLAQHILQVAKALEISLTDKYTDLRLHAGRAVDSIGHAMQLHITSTDEQKLLTMDKSIAFWQILLNGPLVALLQDEQQILRAIGCDCLGSIGPDIFEHLPKDKQILIVTLLFSCSRDEESNVKGAAVRALAISVLYPTLREDIGFILDTAEGITRTLDDSNLLLRIKSSWSLGNLSDALVLYKKNLACEELPNSLILKLLWAAIKIADDNNKIKSNAARSVGNLLRLITTELLKQQTYKEITEKAISVLVTNSTKCSDMKVRWNSCYAIGNMMKNDDLFIGSKSWQHDVYNSLTNLVVNCHNFKVRINAALALSVPNKRSHYDKYYFSILRALLEALENSQNIEDFTEFKHRDTLIDQICMSICHLMNFLTKDDLHDVSEIIVYHADSLKTHMQRVQERLVPENTKILIKAAGSIKDILKEKSSKDDDSVICLLKEIFINDNYV